MNYDRPAAALWWLYIVECDTICPFECCRLSKIRKHKTIVGAIVGLMGSSLLVATVLVREIGTAPSNAATK